jgi:hypothetical protein
MRATVTSIDLPYDSTTYNCHHWLEFRDYLVGDRGKEYVEIYQSSSASLLRR